MAFALGQQVNLLKGLQAIPDQTFHSPSKQAFPVVDSITSGEGGLRSSVVLCNTWSEVTKFYMGDIVSIPISKEVLASDSVGTRDATAFLLDRNQADLTLADAFGIPSEQLNDPNVVFGLVNLYQDSGLVQAGPGGASEKEIQTALFELADQDKTAGGPQYTNYLDFFFKYGTHYIAKVEMGNTARQVFVLDKQSLELAQKGGMVGNFNYLDDFAELTNFSNILRKAAKAQSKILQGVSLPNFDSEYVAKFALPEKGVFNILFDVALSQKFKSSETAGPIKAYLGALKDNFIDPGLADVKNSLATAMDAMFLQRFGPGAVGKDGIFGTVDQKQVVQDIKDLFGSSVPPLLTALPVSTIAISNLYFNLSDLDKSRLRYADAVKSVIVVADTISLSGQVALPGFNIKIICRQFLVDAAPEAPVPKVLVDFPKASWFTLKCQKMVGCIVVKGEERDNAVRETKLEFSQTICNGVVIKDGLAQHSDPESTVRLDFVTSPIEVGDIASMEVLDVIDGTLRTAEIILSHGLTPKQSKLAWDFLLWLSTFTFIKPDDPRPAQMDSEVEKTLKGMFVRIKICLAKGEKFGETLTVPTLGPNAYLKSIDLFMNSVDAYKVEIKKYEDTIKEYQVEQLAVRTHAEMAAQISIIAGFLDNQNHAFAAKEADIAKNNEEMMTTRREEIANLIEKLRSQRTEMEDRKKKTQQAQEELKKRLNEIKEEEKKKRIIKIATGIFTFAVSVTELCLGIPDISGLVGFAATLKMAVDQFDNIKKVFDASKELGNALLDSSGIGSLGTVNMPTDKDWDTYINHVEGQCDSLDVPAARREITAYKVAAKDVGIQGQEISRTMEKLNNLRLEVITIEYNRIVAKEHDKRLTAVSEELKIAQRVHDSSPHLDAIHTNSQLLYQMSALMTTRNRSVVLSLVDVINTLYAALQYEYFVEPPPQFINTEDECAVIDQLANQVLKAFNAKGGFTVYHVTNPVSYTMPVVPVDLLMGSGYTFDLHYDSAVFPRNYRHVRIRDLHVEFGTDNQPSTAGGEIMVELKTDTTMFDRDLSGPSCGKPLSFMCAAPGDYQCLYNLRDPRRELVSRTSSDNIQYTPFTTWTLRVPDSFAANKGLIFPKPTAKVTIKFDVDVVVKEDPGAVSNLPSGSVAKAPTVDPIDGMVQDDQFPKELKGDYQAPDGGPNYNVALTFGPDFPLITLKTVKGEGSDVAVARVTASIVVGSLASADASVPAIGLPGKFFRMEADFKTFKNGSGDTLMLYRDLLSLRLSDDNKATVVDDDGKPVTWRDLGEHDENDVYKARGYLEDFLRKCFVSGLKKDAKLLLRFAPQDMVQTMLNKTILGEWDVVCCMDAAAINQLLKSEYELELQKYKSSPEKYEAGKDSVFYSSVINIKWKTPWKQESMGSPTEQWSQREIHYKLGPPFLQFPPNQPGYVLVRHEILEGGRTVVLQTRTALKPGQKKEVTQEVKFDLPAPRGAVLEAVVSLSQMNGSVEASPSGSEYATYIRMGAAKWDLLGDSYTNVIATTAAADINDYFQETPMGDVKIKLGTGSFVNNVPEIGDALKPRTFRVTTITKGALSNGRLLFFIATKSKPTIVPTDLMGGLVDMLMERRFHAETAMEEPFTAALYVSSKILFGDILANQMNGLFKDVGMSEGWCEMVVRNSSFADSALMLKGKDASRLKLGDYLKLNQEFQNEADKELAKYANAKLGDMPLNGVTLEATGNRIATTFKTTVEIKDAPHAGNEEIAITCDFADLVPFLQEDPELHTFVGLGTWELRKDVADATRYEGWTTKPNGKFTWKCQKKRAERLLRRCNEMAAKVFDAALSKIQVNLKAVSIFNLSNLMFPDQSVIDFKEVYVPGDLLIVGGVRKKLTPPTTVAKAPAAASMARAPPGPRPATVNRAPAAPSTAPESLPAEVAGLPSVFPTLGDLLSQIRGRSFLKPWAIAVALPISQLSSADAEVSLAPSVKGEWIDKLGNIPAAYKYELVLGRPTVAFIDGDGVRMQVDVAITTGTVTKELLLKGGKREHALDLDMQGGTISMQAAVLDATDASGYRVSIDLPHGRIVAVADPNDTLPVGFAGGLERVLMDNLSPLPLAILPPLVPTKSGDVPEELLTLDTFGFRLVPRSGGQGAVVLGAGSSKHMGGSAGARPLAALNDVPVASNVKACVYVSNDVLIKFYFRALQGKGGPWTSALIKDSEDDVTPPTITCGPNETLPACAPPLSKSKHAESLDEESAVTSKASSPSDGMDAKPKPAGTGGSSKDTKPTAGGAKAGGKASVIGANISIPMSGAQIGESEDLVTPPTITCRPNGREDTEPTAATGDIINIPLSGIRIGVGGGSPYNLVASWNQEWQQKVSYLLTPKDDAWPWHWSAPKAPADVVAETGVATATFKMTATAGTSAAIKLEKDGGDAAAGLVFPALQFKHPLLAYQVPAIFLADRPNEDQSPGAKQAAKGVAHAAEAIVSIFRVPEVEAGAGVLGVASGFASIVSKSLAGLSFKAAYAPGDLVLTLE